MEWTTAQSKLQGKCAVVKNVKKASEQAPRKSRNLKKITFMPFEA